MTRDELQHQIDCAYDCDEFEFAHRLEAQLKSMPEPARPAQPAEEIALDPYADTATLFGVTPGHATRYRATVVDLIPGVSDEARASEASNYGYGETIAQAEQAALAGSAVNCDRRVYVEEWTAPYRTVKGPYVLRAKREGK